MSDGRTSSGSVQLKVFSLTAVVVSCYLISQYSGIHFFPQIIPSLEHSHFFPQFEQHFWQFIFSFLAISFLSRGHLWSYGITSKNLKISMKWLAGLYAGTIALTFILWLLKIEILFPLEEITRHKIRETVLLMLTYWMSSPVANQLLFFGLAQTALMKQWGEEIKIFGLPVPVICSAALFTLWSTSVSVTSDPVSIILTAMLGLYCGVVYWKTGSLIAPMLGQAFYFGFPMVIQLA